MKKNKEACWFYCIFSISYDYWILLTLWPDDHLWPGRKFKI